MIVEATGTDSGCFFSLRYKHELLRYCRSTKGAQGIFGDPDMALSCCKCDDLNACEMGDLEMWEFDDQHVMRI